MAIGRTSGKPLFIIDINWDEEIRYKLLPRVPGPPRADWLPLQQGANARAIYLLPRTLPFTQLLKDGFNTGLTKNFHVYLPLAALVVFGVTSFAVFWNHDTGTIELAKKNIPGYKYLNF